MAQSTCTQCGATWRGDKLERLCARCSAEAIANVNDARKKKVIAPAPDDGIFVPTQRVFESSARPGNDPLPSIFREYHYSFLQILLANIAWVAALIVFVLLML